MNTPVTFEIANLLKEKVFYRVVTPDTFSNQEFDTLENAKEWLIQFGTTPDNEYYQFWQEKMKQCKLFKVTENIEDVK